MINNARVKLVNYIKEDLEGLKGPTFTYTHFRYIIRPEQHSYKPTLVLESLAKPGLKKITSEEDLSPSTTIATPDYNGDIFENSYKSHVYLKELAGSVKKTIRRSTECTPIEFRRTSTKKYSLKDKSSKMLFIKLIPCDMESSEEFKINLIKCENSW
jgi:hypothetical protein